MSRTIPIIKLHDILIVSVQIELSDRLVMELKSNVAEEVRRQNVTGLVIEVSGVDIFDSFIARSVRDIAQIARLMGVQTVLAGLDSAMAVTLVEMGMTMEGVATALNLEEAVDHLARLSRAEESMEDLFSDETTDVTTGEIAEGGVVEEGGILYGDR